MLIRLLLACTLTGLVGLGYFAGRFSSLPELSMQIALTSDVNPVGINPAVQPISSDIDAANDPGTPGSVPAAVLEEEREIRLESDAQQVPGSQLVTPGLNDGNQSQSTPNVDNRKLRDELEHQLLNVNRLRARVADLEWETLVLQSDLLDSDTELAQVRDELEREREQAKRTDVYNITNVPLGGVVVAEPVSDTYEPPLPLIPSNSVELDNSVGNNDPSFYGPAPDRYEDLVNSSAAVPFNQNQGQGGSALAEPNN